MKITIGENIKRLRRAHSITQEQLAEALNISITAVSKWERNETYPDITMLFPIAHYFHISLDELMGYDYQQIEKEICEALSRYSELMKTSLADAQEWIIELYKRFPNDYRVMSTYMWNIGGDYADNDPRVLLKHKEEFLKICRRILEGCTNVQIRLDAYNMMGKLLHAEGQTEDALKMYVQEFPDWYMTAGQKSEQLFAKNTPEFCRQLRLNMYELTDFAANKKVKDIWFCQNDSIEEKAERGMRLAYALAEMRTTADIEELCLAEYHVLSELLAKLEASYAPQENIDKCRKQRAAVKVLCNRLAEKRDTVRVYMQKRYGNT